MSTPVMTKLEQRDRFFMTGASCYIGSVITEFTIEEGYDVYGLSRTEKSDAKLTSLGAVPVRGDLSSLDVLRRESAQAQIVLCSIWRMLGGYREAACGRLPTGAETTESTPPWQTPLNHRIRAEQHALQLCERGVKMCAVRLAPYVYGRGGSGIRLFMQMSVNNGESTSPTSSIHSDDAARLFLLATKKAKAGDVFNATSSTDVTARQMAEAMGSALNISVRSLTFEETASKTGELLAKFLSAENRASNTNAIRELGWQPREPRILEDIRTGSYQAVAEELRKSGV